VRLEPTDDFSIHQYRSKLKLLADNGDRRVLENRDGLRCPSCGEPFQRLVVIRTQTMRFETPPDGPFCLARAGEKLLVVTHGL